MASKASIDIIGNLGNNAELITATTGMKICKFRVCVNGRKDNNGNAKQTWYKVSLFGSTAENLAQYLTKGKLVNVEGDLEVNDYVDKDGVNRYSLEIKAIRVVLLGDKPNGEASLHVEEAEQATAAQPAAAQAAPTASKPVNRGTKPTGSNAGAAQK